MALENGYVHVVQVGKFVFLPLEWILKLEAGLHHLKYLVIAVLRSPNTAKFRTSVLKCWRLCRLSSMFKIHSKGKKKQMSVRKQHVHIPFLTPWIVFVGINGHLGTTPILLLTLVGATHHLQFTLCSSLQCVIHFRSGKAFVTLAYYAIHSMSFHDISIWSFFSVKS